jgi:hypothetical protein
MAKVQTNNHGLLQELSPIAFFGYIGTNDLALSRPELLAYGQ